MDGYSYATFANKETSNANTLNILTVVVAHTILFTREYQYWHALPDAQKTLDNAFKWRTAKEHIMKKYNKVSVTVGRSK